MSLSQKFKEGRVFNKKIGVLEDAIRAGNVAVATALTEDVKTSPRFDRVQNNLVELALEAGDVNIFAALHATLEDPNYYFVSTQAFGNSRPGTNYYSNYKMHILNVAIEEDKADIALYLARHPGVTVTEPGEKITLVGHHSLQHEELPSAVSLAEKKRMSVVAAVLRNRLSAQGQQQKPGI